MLFLLQRVHRQCVSYGTDQSRPVQLRFAHTVPRSGPDELSHRLFVGVFREQDKGNGHTRMQKLGHQADCLRVSSFVLEQDQPVALPLEHHLRFVQRVSMVQVGIEHVARALQDLADQEEVLLLVAHE